GNPGIAAVAELRDVTATDPAAVAALAVEVATGGPALLDAAHWATERPWLDELAGWLRAQFPVTSLVSDLDTDPWTVHAVSGK
ncbi:hypothetical protein AB0C29_23470, partial [Actinoplanes sp. NPDC048791]